MASSAPDILSESGEAPPRRTASALRRLLRFVGLGERLPADDSTGAWTERAASGSHRVLLAGGLGYNNVGDEAQIAANLQRWRRACPSVELLVLSPKPGLTSQQHATPATWAPRQVWFRSEDSPHYFRSGLAFKLWFWLAWIRQTLSARLLRRGLPPLLANSDESRLLRCVSEADLLHISGGGFLTGMTQSRLWENCLLMRLCQILGTPYFLTGQTIGVFSGMTDRKLAYLALAKAHAIYSRDPSSTIAELRSIGIQGDHVRPGCDDALLCEKAEPAVTRDCLVQCGIDPGRPYLVANYHHWGQDPDLQRRSIERFAELCQTLADKASAQILFIPMVPSDESAELKVVELLKSPSRILQYGYDYRLARGAFSSAFATITMKHHPIIFSFGEGVPVLSIALDSYYLRKNKGAMAHCGQEHLCLDRESFFDHRAFDAVALLVEQRQKPIDAIESWIQSARDQELQPISDIMQQIGMRR